MGYLDEKRAETLPLSFNYRSTKNILRCAEAVIKNNTSRVSESLETENNDGEFVKLICCSNYFDESNWVSDEVEKLINLGYSASDIAILYRTNVSSRPFEQGLRMKGINCKIIGGKSFFDLVVVKGCMH
jgi:DNA helicase-2/ATP-dependent DNA helicase PcrA